MFDKHLGVLIMDKISILIIKNVKIITLCALLAANKPAAGWWGFPSTHATVTVVWPKAEPSSVKFKALHSEVQALHKLLVKVEQCIEKVTPLYQFLLAHPDYQRHISSPVSDTRRFYGYFLHTHSHIKEDISSSTMCEIIRLLDKEALEAGDIYISIQEAYHQLNDKKDTIIEKLKDIERIVQK